MYKDQVIIITGASQGIGKSIAQAFALAGAKIAGIYHRNTKEAHHTLNSLNNRNLHKMYSCDLSKEEGVKSTLNQILLDFGKVHVLINNAGITQDSLLFAMTASQIDAVLDTNLKSAFFTSKFTGRSFLKNKYGRIINISSISGIDGNPGQTNYAASKAGLIGFTKSLAKELASKNITVNAIAPGFIQTKMTQDLPLAQIELAKNKIPCKRLGLGEDIAHACLFLASPQSSYITGQVLRVDGGLQL